VKYDPLTSFDPVVPFGRHPLVLCVRADFPGNTLADVIKAAKASPGTVKYASWGLGSIPHLAGLFLERSAGVKMLHVPYKSGSAAHMALLAREVDLLVMAQLQAMAQQKAGKSKMLAVTTTTRSRSLPDVPTMAELGHPEFAWDFWIALFAPAGTPKGPRDIVAREVNAYLQSPEGQAKFKGFGYETIGGTTADLERSLREGNQRWARIIQDSGFRIE
jgi:tripartite-type tricarboxylate transporter receptor subunit TctC